MNFRILGDNDLSDFAANVYDQLRGAEITAIDPNVRNELVAAIGVLPGTLAMQTADAAVAEDSRKAAFSARNDTKFQLQALMSQVRDALKAGLAPKKQYDLCGFDYAKDRSIIIAQAPTNLVATGTSNGVNRLTFNGNNRTGTVVYEIWRLHGDTVPFSIIATTKKQLYTDTPVTPGEYYNYKVRAVAASNASEFSNVAVVYGSI
jgi:hypothetical protein